MGKQSAPQAPDPYATASTQYQFGTKAADYSKALNNVNTVGPTGSTSYQITGQDPTTGAPIYTQTTTLTPEQQQLLKGNQDVQKGGQGIALGEQGAASQGLGTVNGLLSSGAPNTPDVSYGPGFDPGTGYNSGFSTALAGEEAAMQPGLSQEREQMDASLRNAGATPGSPAYDNAMAALDARQANSQTQAAGSAVTAGTGVANQLQMAASQDTQLHNQGISQSLSDYAQRLGIPMSAITSLLSSANGAAGGPSVPGAINPSTANVAAPDYAGMVNNQYQGQLAGYNAGVSTQNGMLGDLTSLGSAALMLSDERMKDDMEEVGKMKSGLPIYRFTYKGSHTPQVGVSAQEAEKKFPKAVHEVGGLKFVNYAGVA